MNGLSIWCLCKSWASKKTALVPLGCPNLERHSPTLLCFEGASLPLGGGDRWHLQSWGEVSEGPRGQKGSLYEGNNCGFSSTWEINHTWRAGSRSSRVTQHSAEGVILAKDSSMAVLKLEQDTEWHWRMVLLSCLDLLSTAGLSHRQGHLLDQETAASHHLGVCIWLCCILAGGIWEL